MLGCWRCVRPESQYFSQPSTWTLRVHKRPSIAVHRYTKGNHTSDRSSENRRGHSLLTTCKSQQGIAARKGKRKKEPIEARVLTAILGLTSVPYSSFIPQPETFLHSLHAVVKQLWLVALIGMMARASPTARLAIALGVAALSALALPSNLWRPQLKRLGLLAAFIFVATAIGADGVPPVQQERGLPAAMEGLPDRMPFSGGYRYVIFHFCFITITRRSLSVAIAASCLTFVALQSASLCLTTTPAEEMALGLKFWLAPLRVVRAPVDEICMTLLLSLRFMSVVFDELRNLSLGLAARSVPWKQLPPGAGLQVLLRLGGRLFSNLMQRSESISLAMQARGFQGPESHTVHLGAKEHVPLLPNAIALLALPLTIAGGLHFIPIVGMVYSFTPEELSKYDGVKDKKIYFSIRGTVYDVSKAPDFYGPGCGYHIFAGKECARALALMSLKPEDCNSDITDLDESKIKILDDWQKKFDEKYEKVGLLAEEETEDQVP